MIRSTMSDVCDGNAILVVDSDAAFARGVARIARSAGLAARVVVDAAIASVELKAPQIWRAAIVTADALSVVEVVRQSCTTLPLIVTAKTASPLLINRCFVLGATLITKPLSDSDQEALQRWFAHGASDCAAARVSAYARARALTARQTQVLVLAASGVSRAEIADCLGMSVHTLKGHVTQLLDRCGAPSLRSLVSLCAEARRD